MRLVCNRTQAATGLFTVGKVYETQDGPGHLLTVHDDMGHERCILRDTLRFCISHDHADNALYAFFAVADENGGVFDPDGLPSQSQLYAGRMVSQG